MRKIKDVLRLRLSGGLSIRQIRASTKISVGAIQKLLARAEELWKTGGSGGIGSLSALFPDFK